MSDESHKETQKNDEKTAVTINLVNEAENQTPPEDALREELTRAKNEYLYLRAEFDNYRRQATKERSDLIRFAGERLAKDLLDTLDIFDSALAADVN